MTETVDPKDLARFQAAKRDAQANAERFAEVQRALAKAQQDVQGVRDACIAAEAILRRRNADLMEDHDLQPGDNVHPETGVITRGPRAEPAQSSLSAAHHRWNTRQEGDELWICRGEHDKSADCVWERDNQQAPQE